jgi:RNA polymerase sigma factor (sigma-70 family)
MGEFTEDRALWIARYVLPHEPALRAQLRRWHLPDDLDPDDIVQEAYSRFAAMPSVDEVWNPKNYLFMIVHNLIVNHIRRARVVPILTVDNLESFVIAADEPSPEAMVSDREQLQMLSQAISELPEPKRSAFVMRVIDELPYRQIGEKLGMSDNAVQKTVAKCLNLMLARFGRGGNDDGRASIQNPGTHGEWYEQARNQRGD